MNGKRILRYQKHRRGCPCLQCDDLRETRRQKFMEIGSRILAWTVVVLLLVVIAIQMWFRPVNLGAMM